MIEAQCYIRIIPRRHIFVKHMRKIAGCFKLPQKMNCFLRHNIVPCLSNLSVKEQIKMNILFMLHPKNTVDYLTENTSMFEGLKKMRGCGYTALPVINDE